jgi:hypothetical protein
MTGFRTACSTCTKRKNKKKILAFRNPTVKEKFRTAYVALRLSKKGMKALKQHTPDCSHGCRDKRVTDRIGCGSFA